MSARPAPRRSSLAGDTPTAPAKAPPPSPPPPSPLPPSQAPAPPVAAATPAPEPALARKYRHKVSFYQAEADTDRVRAAILHTQALVGRARTLSQFIDSAVMAEVARLEAQYNDGQPWPPVSARELPQGRPMGD